MECHCKCVIRECRGRHLLIGGEYVAVSNTGVLPDSWLGFAVDHLYSSIAEIADCRGEICLSTSGGFPCDWLFSGA
jgi:hypothetical protein